MLRMTRKEISKGKKISVKHLKQTLRIHYHDGAFISILLSEPDEMTIEEFIGAVGVWLSILDAEKQQVFNPSIPNLSERERK